MDARRPNRPPAGTARPASPARPADPAPPADQRAESATSLGVAALRAAHMLLDGPPKILDDPVAARLLDPARLQGMLANPGRVRAPGARRLRAHVLLRSRYTEDRLFEAYQHGVRQYLLLGAGLDTFAYRQPAWAGELRIFEVDHPGSQQGKAERFRRAGIAAPPNLTAVAADFEDPGSLERSLTASGFDPGRPAVAACLGVLMYLRDAAVEEIFRFAGRLAAGSEFLFTLAPPPEDPSAAAGAERLQALAAELGEPWLSRMTAGAAIRRLRELGFSEVFAPSREALEKRYFAGRTDGLEAPIHVRIVVARR